LERSTIRVLVVDDNIAWRRFVCSTLQNKLRLQVVAEAADGLDAVRKAQELKPDLVLMDIGLPAINGIEATQRIRHLLPQSKVVCLTENRYWDIAQEALRSGASAYVVKADAGRELVTAVTAVLQGEQFVSASLDGALGEDLRILQDTHGPRVEGLPAPVRIRHEVEFYSDDDAFAAGFADAIKSALRLGKSAILIASELHRAGVLRKLQDDGVDVVDATERGNYLSLDAHQAVKLLMHESGPDPVRCEELICDLVTKAARVAKGPHPKVAICGECAPQLLAQGNTEAAIQLEHIWNEKTTTYNADTLCGYLASAFAGEQGEAIRERIAREHAIVHACT
jgi:DNA-binding NarL/FixJ family response regulator